MIEQIVFLLGKQIAICLRDAYLFTFYDVEQERVSDDYQYVIDMRGENVLYPELDLSSDDWALRIVLADTFSGNTGLFCNMGG